VPAQFTSIVAILGSVSIPQHGVTVEAHTVTGTPLRISSDASGTVTVSSPESIHVASISTTLAANPDSTMPQQLPAVNLRSCAGLMHVITAVQEVAEVGVGEAGHADLQVRVAGEHVAATMSTDSGYERQEVRVRGSRGPRRLLSNLWHNGQQSWRALGLRSILQSIPRIPSFAPNLDTADAPAACKFCVQCDTEYDDTGDIGDPVDPPDLSGDFTAGSTLEPCPSSLSPSSTDPRRPSAIAPSAPALSSEQPSTAQNGTAAAPSEAPAPAPDSGLASTIQNDGDRVGNNEEADPPAESGTDNGWYKGGIKYSIIAVAIAVVILIIVGIWACHRKRDHTAGGPKSISVQDGSRMDQHQLRHFDNRFSRSMSLRDAQAQHRMVCVPLQL
jgi:hypothetical protein